MSGMSELGALCTKLACVYVGRLGAGALVSSYGHFDHRAYLDTSGHLRVLPWPCYEPHACAPGDVAQARCYEARGPRRGPVSCAPFATYTPARAISRARSEYRGEREQLRRLHILLYNRLTRRATVKGRKGHAWLSNTFSFQPMQMPWSSFLRSRYEWWRSGRSTRRTMDLGAGPARYSTTRAGADFIAGCRSRFST